MPHTYVDKYFPCSGLIAEKGRQDVCDENVLRVHEHQVRHPHHYRPWHCEQFPLLISPYKKSLPSWSCPILRLSLANLTLKNLSLADLTILEIAP